MLARGAGGGIPGGATLTRIEAMRDVASAWHEVLETGPAAFGAFCEIPTRGTSKIRFAYDRWHTEQRLFEKHRTGRDIILKPRQIGFTTLELIRDICFGLRYSGVQVLIVCQDDQIAEVLFQRAHIIQRSLHSQGLAPKPKFATRREIVWPHNDSAVRIIEAGATDDAASKKGRSGTIHRLHATEVAFWGAADKTLTALLGSVPDDEGEVVLESTANGAGGEFYERFVAAMNGQSPYRPHFYPWLLHDAYRRPVEADFDPAPRDEWEELIRERDGDDQQIAWWRFRLAENNNDVERILAEFPIDPSSAFRGSGEPYISPAAVDQMEPLEPLELLPLRGPKGENGSPGLPLGDLRVYERPVPGETYLVTGDVAEGVAADASASQVLHARSGRICASFDSDTLEPKDFADALYEIAVYYGNALVAPERNKEGAAVIKRLVERRARVWRALDGKPGWVTTQTSRVMLFDDLRAAIEKGSATTPDTATIGELRTLVRGPKGKPEAKGKSQPRRVKSRKKKERRCRDDLFVAWGIGLQVIALMDVSGDAPREDQLDRLAQARGHRRGAAMRGRSLRRSW